MTASCLSTPLPPFGLAPLRRAAAPRRQRRRCACTVRVAGVLPLVVPVVAGLLMLAALAAPEQPDRQQEICLRHNTAAACRVW